MPAPTESGGARPAPGVGLRAGAATLTLAVGLGLLLAPAGCGPPEAGSITLPEGMELGAKAGYGPSESSAKAAPTRFSPRDEQIEPTPRATRAKGYRR